MEFAKNLTLEAPVTEEAAPSLSAVEGLLRHLHQENVEYCHWKSNEHLQAALLGITDLDMLVDRHQSLKLSRMLAEAGFKRFAAVPHRSYPGVEDYLALDRDTGTLIHLHLHHELTVGEKNLKGYRIPWERFVLSTRCYAPREGIYVTQAEIEMVLLFLRSALRIRSRDRLMAWLGRPYFRKALMNEYAWLKRKIQADALHEISAGLLGIRATRVVEDMIAGEPSLPQLVLLRRTTRKLMESYRTFGAVGARLRRWLREIQVLRLQVVRRRTQAPVTRTLPSGGVTIALLGADGSGKSTLVRELVKWLSRKVDARSLYYGSGDGPSSLLRLPLKWAYDRLVNDSRRHQAAPSTPNREGASTESTVRRMAKRLRPIWALLIAYEKRRKLRWAVRARNRGMLVICDRYPQNQVMGYNDGPLLSSWLTHRSRLLRVLARWERAPYQWADTHPPDIVVKLHVTPDAARQRKPEARPGQTQKKANAIRRIEYSPPTRTVDIDADDSFSQVLLQVKRCVWDAI